MENDYRLWGLSLMTIIASSVFSNDIKLAEIKAVLNGDYKENFVGGDTPLEAWIGETDAIENEAERV